MQLPLRGVEKGTYTSKLQGNHLVFVNERECISLKSIDHGKNVVTEEVEKLCSSHEEVLYQNNLAL